MLDHLLATFQFLLVLLGDLIGVQVASNLSVGDDAVLLLGAVILLVAGWTLIVDGLRRDEVGTTPIEAALISFGLLFVLITTIGRVQFGLSQAGESRYSTYDVLIVVGCYLALLGRAGAGSTVGRWSSDDPATQNHGLLARLARARRGLTSRPARLVVGATVAGIVLLQAALGTTNGLVGARSWHQAGLAAADVTANIDKAPDALLPVTLGCYCAYDPGYVRRLAHIAETRHLGLFGTSAAAEFEREGLFVDRGPPSTTVAVPRQRSVLRGNKLLAAAASDVYGVTKVEFELTGGVLRSQLIVTATHTRYGWLAAWNTTTVRNGNYTLKSVARDSSGKQGVSLPVAITVSN